MDPVRTGRELLEELVAQESRLVFDHFDEDTAWALGVALREAALAAALPVAISIRRNGQRLFHAALPGSSADNDGWLARKSAVVDRYGRSSLRVGEQFRVDGGSFDPDARLHPSDYAAHGGAFPIRRGHRDEEAFKTADAILERKECMLIYVEGGRSRTRGLGEPRPGIGRIALESGVPVVPMAIHGSAGVRGWKRLRFPKVTIQYGEPIAFAAEANPSRERQQEVANKVFDQVRKMYVALEEQGRRGVIRSLRKGLPAPEPGKASGAER